MKRDVLITLSGLQMNPETALDELSPLEVISPGVYYRHNGFHYLVFEEYDEDFKKPTRNKIKFNTSMVEVLKTGAINARLLFEPGRKNPLLYDTPYGAIPIDITSGPICLSEEDALIRILLNYELGISYRPFMNCELSITVIPSDQLSLDTEAADLSADLFPDTPFLPFE